MVDVPAVIALLSSGQQAALGRSRRGRQQLRESRRESSIQDYLHPSCGWSL